MTAISGPFRLSITADTFDYLTLSARRALPRETGGLLLGVRVDNDVYVVDAVRVRDPNASRTRFVLRETERQEALEAFRSANPEAPDIGYVGTWHSHPACSGASWRDRCTFRVEAIRADDLVAMVVLKKHDDGGWSADGYVARKHRVTRSDPTVG